MPIDHNVLLRVAIDEARKGLSEGGIPVGAALFDSEGNLLGSGRNRRVQDGDPSAHGETDAFRKAGRQKTYRDKILATTLAPCWYCSGLVRQFRVGTVVVGESVNFAGGLEKIQRAVRIGYNCGRFVQDVDRYIAEEFDIERKFRETRLYQVAPISTNLIFSYIAEHVLGLPRSF